MTQHLHLEVIRVMDLSRIIAGRTARCSWLIGAEVIKLKFPVAVTTALYETAGSGGEGHFYLAFNRNKQSAVI